VTRVDAGDSAHPLKKKNMTVLKSILAVLAGIIFIVVTHMLTDFILESLGIFPPPPNRAAPGQRFDVPWMVATALTYRIIFQIAGGYLTAFLAPSRPVFHSVILGLIGLVMSIAAAIATIPLDWGPAWYPIGLAISSLPSVWFGGWLASRRPQTA
jgi:hypothetical protein